MNYTESAVVFDCRGDLLVGISAEPDRPAGSTGVIIVVGGPQYRAGSHRQFVLLARHLAQSGVPCLRFDYRGMGDSTGDARDFTGTGDDIRAATDKLLERVPEVKHVVLWGLCDGATAAAFYAAEDTRISGVILLNPWVHTEQAEAKVYLKHYYLSRLASATFWRRLVAGEVSFGAAVLGSVRLFRRAWDRSLPGEDSAQSEVLPLPERLYKSLTTRPLQILILLSGRDFVAREFEGLLTEDRWLRVISSAQIERLPDADHTFSEPTKTDHVNRLTLEWVRSHSPDQ